MSELLALLDTCTEKQRQYILAVVEHGSIREASRALGVHSSTIDKCIAKARVLYATKQRAPIPSRVRSPNMSYEQLVQDRIKTHKRKAAHDDDMASLTLTLPISGPYGFVVFGDPHLDDDGTDWMALRRHTDLVKATEGLYAVNIGDTTNNWVGRLARLYANQRTTDAEALILARGWVRELAGKWLFQISGNHNDWSGAQDPMVYFAEEAESTYIQHGAKICIRQGPHKLFVHARHSFAGNSMWNTAHGVGRSVLMGNTEHLTIAGHIHTTGQMVIKAPSGRICHAVQVASYKIIDAYAKAGNFRDNHISPACCFVIDHRYPETDPRMVNVFHSVEAGAAYLEYLRADR